MLTRSIRLPSTSARRSSSAPMIRPPTRKLVVIASVNWSLQGPSGKDVPLARLWENKPHQEALDARALGADVELLVEGTDRDANKLQVVLTRGATACVLNGKKLTLNHWAQMKPGDLLVVGETGFRVMRGTLAHA